MVTDKHNKIYTELLQHMKDTYPTIKGGTEYKDTPPSLPYMYFFQIDASTRLTTLSDTEDGINLAFQIEFYGKGKDEVRKMANTARSFMISEGFRCQAFMPSQVPTNVSRFLTRFGRLDV